MKPLRIGMLGCGTVGTGVAKILQQHARHLTQRSGRSLDLVKVVVRDLERTRDVPIPARQFCSNPSEVLTDPDIDVIVELVGGLEPARSWIEIALEQGKEVVTANKALLATHGRELVPLARRFQRTIAFEAAVAGGIPAIATLRQSLTANEITGLLGILNGTSNFILSSMEEQGTSYEAALQQAQDLGYAEADPALDVDGSDAAQKLALLAQLAFQLDVDWSRIPRRGLEGISAFDLQWAGIHGYRIKPLAMATRFDQEGERAFGHEGLDLEVSPMLLSLDEPAARTLGAVNGLRWDGDAVGPLWMEGYGAGQLPTASAVVSDLVDIACGRARVTDRSWPLWPELLPRWRWSGDYVHRRYYVRVTAPDTQRLEALVSAGQALGLRWTEGTYCSETQCFHQAGLVGPITMTQVHACEATLAKVAEGPHAACQTLWLPMLD